MFDKEVQSTIGEIARQYGVEPAALLAIADVESGGTAFAEVDGRREPLIRFEGHYFDQRLTGEKRRRARSAGLASPLAGAVANPKTQAGRWRLLAAAAEIDHQAAHESVSWGLGQVMGAHWQWLGLANIDALVAEARGGIEGQVRLMARYIDKVGLVPAIQKRNWEAFARAYNGPSYARNAYHTRIADAYQRYADGKDNPIGDSINPGPEGGAQVTIELVARQSKAEENRELQRLLSAKGYALDIDGILGRATKKAIRAFQADNGLEPDGIAGPKTLAALTEKDEPAGWHPGRLTAILGALRRAVGLDG